LPGEGLPSVLVEIDPGPAGEQTVLERLRAADPPVIARAERGRVVVDLRTVPPRQDQAVLQALREALSPGGRAD
jgi:L-seryl-tRNA(Ser) seleniumtransferase